MVSAESVSPPYVVSISVTCVFTFLSGIAIALRYLSRRLGTIWKSDDWTIVSAWVFALGSMIITILAAVYGMAGYPATEVDLPHLAAFQQCLLANNLVYNTSIMLSKVAILLMYRRIFDTPSFRFWTWPVFTLIAAYYIIALFVELFGYSPINGQWDPSIPSTHIDEYTFALVMAAYNMVMDILILAMPQVTVWKLQMTLRNRILVGVVFLFGGVVCLATIMRLVYLARINYADATASIAQAGTWTAVEINLAIICACLPTLPAIFVYWFGKDQEKRRNVMSTYLRGKARFGKWFSSRGQSQTQLRDRNPSFVSSLGVHPPFEQPVITHSVSKGTQEDRVQTTERQGQGGVWVQREIVVNDNDRIIDV